MLTPRHQALLATLVGMTLGVAVFGSVLLLNRDPRNEAAAGVITTPSPTTPAPAPSTLSDGRLTPLQPDALRYIHKSIKEGRPKLAADIPKDWMLKPKDSYQERFADSSDTWMIRFNVTASKRSPTQQSELREASVAKSQDLRIVSHDNGRQPTGWNAAGLTHTTLVYTYTDNSHRARMVLSRWLSVDGGKRSIVEITAAGRPQDGAALHVILERATESLELRSA
jgi:hypothetical protein